MKTIIDQPQKVRIVMTGPHGEKDYVEKILDGGIPCICGSDPDYAGIWPIHEAASIVMDIRHNWLTPHVDVSIEQI